MRRTYLASGDVLGSVMAWPFQLSLSHNRRLDRWTVYVRYTDPDYPSTVSFTLRSPWDLKDLTEQLGITIEWFVEQLDKSEVEEFRALRDWVAPLLDVKWGMEVV